MAWIAPARYLTQAEMENNAREIWAWWQTIGGTRESCAALLGNMQRESTINPALPEQGHTFTDVITFGWGYGLIQWTPCSRYYSLFNSIGLDITQPRDQLTWLNYECQPGRGYYYYNGSYDYEYWSWPDFIRESDPGKVAALTECFCWSRERPGTPAMDERIDNAHRWYTFLGGVVPTRPPLWLLFKLRERSFYNGVH